jgi:hypothetical protein
MIFFLCAQYSLLSTFPTLQEDALFEATLKLLERALPGVNLYVGLLRPGGNQLTFVAATAKSQMSGKAMQRGQGGVSFDCLGPGYAKNGVSKMNSLFFLKQYLVSNENIITLNAR